MTSLNGLPWLFWGIALALPAWYWIHRRWMGAHLKDGALNRNAIETYIPPSGACKTIERF
jgi:hypothetical protein